MHEFLVNFQDLNLDGTLPTQESAAIKRKKTLRVEDNVCAVDEDGNRCYGFIGRFDPETGFVGLVLDKTTYQSAIR